VPYRSAYMGDINTRISTVFFSGIKLIKIEDILGTAQILHGRHVGYEQRGLMSQTWFESLS
jgi:hypothetical protein